MRNGETNIKKLVSDALSWGRHSQDVEADLYIQRLAGALKRSETRRKRLQKLRAGGK